MYIVILSAAKNLEFVFDIRNNLAVEQVNCPLGAGGVLLGVGYHHDGGSFSIQFLQKIHDLLPFLISNDTPLRAVVSISSVRKILERLFTIIIIVAVIVSYPAVPDGTEISTIRAKLVNYLIIST